ncbi:MAG: hypothetical protein IKQ10_11490 [Oscillospiraceae bacterium]|nr:hypothetical protein [Oscillospiraceae bacterium]
MANEIFSALEPLGFTAVNNICCGVWKDYAVSLRPLTGRTFYVDTAVRLPSVPAGLRRTLGRALKEPGLKIGGVEAVRKNVITVRSPLPSRTTPLPAFPR